jgi:hypothetical protein
MPCSPLSIVQTYARHLLTLVSEAPGSPLHRAAGKSALVALLPFFSDDVIDMAALPAGGNPVIDDDDAASTCD